MINFTIDGEYPALDSAPTEVRLPEGVQAVFYENEDFQGNSVVLSAHDGEKTFRLAETNLAHVRSLRVLTNINIIPGRERDSAALEEAVSWRQKAMEKSSERTKWWEEAKFGCFVHWGVYAIAGGEWNGMRAFYAEHMKRVAKISQEDYKKHFIEAFNPVDFDADQWISTIKDAGMKYFVITAKHHDGFAMYHSDVYPYDMRMTPYKDDPIMALKKACDKHGIKFGMYYSHAFDWEHPDGAGNDWEYTNGGGDLHLFEGELGLWFNQHPELVPRTAKYYVDQKSIPQVVELIKKYQPALLWFDTSHKLPVSENLRILKAIWDTDINVVVNGRIAPNWRFGPGADYANTGDRAAEIFPTPGLWETIPTTNESYGYSKHDKSHKPPEHFIKLLIKAAAKGGNVLMNVGPNARGTIENIDLEILAEVGKWLKINGEAIYGTSRSPLFVQTFGETTVKGNKLYLHVYNEDTHEITLGGVLNQFDKVYMLADSKKTPLSMKRVNQYDTVINLPSKTAPYSVVVAEFTGELFVGGGRLISGTEKESLHVFDASYTPPIPAVLSRGDGKTGNDYVHCFTSTEQSIIWKVRTSRKTQYKLEVKYTTMTPDIIGEYSIYVGGHKQIKPITAANKFRDIISDSFLVEIDGEDDISFRPEKINGEFLHLYGVELTPVDKTLTQAIRLEEDTTDLGG